MTQKRLRDENPSDETAATALPKPKRWKIETVREAFSERGFTLTEEQYVNNKTLLTYTCSCGEAGCKIRLDHMLVGHNNCKPCAHAKRQSTMVQRHGAAHAMQVPELRAKAQHTMIQRHGAANPQQVAELRAKQQDTMMQRHGAATPMQAPDLRARQQASMVERHGVANPSQVPEFREKAQDTMIERHGAAYTMHVPEFRVKREETNCNRYGAANVMQNYDVFQRQQDSAFSNKTHTFPNGETITYQGYELSAIEKLLADGTSQKEIIQGDRKKQSIAIWYTYEGSRHRYYPDLYLPSTNKIIEVKSTYTYNKEKDQNHAKLQQTKADGFDCELWIMSSKGKLTQVITF